MNNQQLLCTWVPGTLDLVCLKMGSRQFETTSNHLSKIFGPHALDDLFLKGHAVLSAEPKQIALLG